MHEKRLCIIKESSDLEVLRMEELDSADSAQSARVPRASWLADMLDAAQY
jgi:hypothetical protein